MKPAYSTEWNQGESFTGIEIAGLDAVARTSLGPSLNPETLNTAGEAAGRTEMTGGREGPQVPTTLSTGEPETPSALNPQPSTLNPQPSTLNHHHHHHHHH